MLAPIVLKFGGSSVGTAERLRNVAKIISQYRKSRNRIVVVVSAMGDTTDDLIALALKVSAHALSVKNRREMDMLLSTGERVSMALLSIALSELGIEAVSFTGSQSGILTDTLHGEARISDIKPIRILESLQNEKVVIVAGFQGVSHSKEITTLGRGGSDTSAVALAVALKAQEAVIYTDVDGIYSADPRIVNDAKHLSHVPWDLCLEAAERGAQVLHPRCIELAWKHRMPIRVLSSFKNEVAGTLVKGVSSEMTDVNTQKNLEGPKVLTLALQRNLVSVEKRGMAATDVASLHKNLCGAGMRFSYWHHSATTMQFVFDESLSSVLEKYLVPDTKREKLAQISIIGMGLLQAPEIYSRAAEILQARGVETLRSSLSSTTLSFLCRDTEGMETAMKELHAAFVA